MKNFIIKNDPDIVCIQETWQIKKINFACYTTYHKPRKGKQGGGLCILVRKNLNCEQIKISGPESDVQKQYEIKG